MEKFDLDEKYELSIQNDTINFDADGNEVKTYRKEMFNLRQLYQMKNSADSTLAVLQNRIGIIEAAQLAKLVAKIE